jgi:hypothetical protein
VTVHLSQKYLMEYQILKPYISIFTLTYRMLKTIKNPLKFNLFHLKIVLKNHEQPTNKRKNPNKVVTSDTQNTKRCKINKTILTYPRHKSLRLLFNFEEDNLSKKKNKLKKKRDQKQ